MKAFTYVSLGSIYETIECLVRHGESARLLAGGTDLLMTMKLGLRSPEQVIDLKSIRGLNYIRLDDGELKIGATTLLIDIENSPVAKQNFPMLARAAHLVASVQIRNMGTAAGNLCQDVQCLYYRNAQFNCYRKGGDQCFAFDGENKYGAIFVVPDSEKCWAGFPSDLAPALIALDAKVKIIGPVGERNISVQEFYCELSNCLQEGEVVVEIIVPKQPTGTKSEYLKLRITEAMGFPIASAAVSLVVENNICTHARIALGGVAPMPWRGYEAEEAMINKDFNKDTISTAIDALMKTAKPLKKSAYKESMVRTLLQRAMLSAGGVNK